MAGFQSIQPFTEPRAQVDDRAQQVERVHQGPWLTSAEACDYLRYVGANRLRSLYRFLRINGVPTVRRTKRTLLIARADLDEALLGRTGRRRQRRAA